MPEPNEFIAPEIIQDLGRTQAIELLLASILADLALRSENPERVIDTTDGRVHWLAHHVLAGMISTESKAVASAGTLFEDAFAEVADRVLGAVRKIVARELEEVDAGDGASPQSPAS